MKAGYDKITLDIIQRDTEEEIMKERLIDVEVQVGKNWRETIFKTFHGSLNLGHTKYWKKKIYNQSRPGEIAKC